MTRACFLAGGGTAAQPLWPRGGGAPQAIAARAAPGRRLCVARVRSRQPGTPNPQGLKVQASKLPDWGDACA